MLPLCPERDVYISPPLMTSNQPFVMLGSMNSTIFIWIPKIGCKNREDEDGTIPPAYMGKQPILPRLFQ